MSGRWKALRWLPFGHTNDKAPSADMKPPHVTTENTIRYILRLAKDKAANRYSGVQVTVSTKELRPGMTLDLAKMAKPIETQAKDYGLLGGRFMSGKFYFTKM